MVAGRGGGVGQDSALAAEQASIDQAAESLERLCLQLEGAGVGSGSALAGAGSSAARSSSSSGPLTAAAVAALDTRARDASAYLAKLVAAHEKVAAAGGGDVARVAAVRNRGRFDALDRRLRKARRVASRVAGVLLACGPSLAGMLLHFAPIGVPLGVSGGHPRGVAHVVLF
jgi:hypothetical protein